MDDQNCFENNITKINEELNEEKTNEVLNEEKTNEVKPEKSKKLAYYTCFLGNERNWAFLVPRTPSEKYDCYYFTNNDTMFKYVSDTKWIPIKLDVPVQNNDILDCMNTKPIRTCPHKLKELEGYKYVCWFDSKLDVDENKIDQLIEELDNNDKKMVLCKHPYQFDTVWGEYNEAIKYPKYGVQKDMYKKYIESKLESGISENLPVHYCGGFTIRNLTDDKVIAFNEDWLENINQCGIEDQISLQFVHQNYTDIIHPIEYKWCWDYNYVHR